MNNDRELPIMKHYKKLLKLFDLSDTGIWEMDAQNRVIFYNVDFYKNFDIPTQNSTLEDWILVGLKLGYRVPVIADASI